MQIVNKMILFVELAQKPKRLLCIHTKDNDFSNFFFTSPHRMAKIKISGEGLRSIFAPGQKNGK